MPKLIKLDPKTGKTVSVEWNGEVPPTDQEWEELIFTQARDIAARQGLIPPGLPGLKINNPAGQEAHPPMSNEEADKHFWSVLGTLGELSVPFALAPVTGGMSLPMRLGTTAITDALTGGVKGALSGRGALNEAAGNAALGVTGQLGGDVFPYLGHTAGQMFGGKFRNLGKDALAFLREGSRRAREGKLRIPLGAAEKTSDQMREAGQFVASAEKANTSKIGLRSTAERGYENMTEDAATANFPLDHTNDARAFVDKYVDQHSRIRPNIKKDPTYPAAEVTEVPETRIGKARRPMLGLGSRKVVDATPADDFIDIEKVGGATVTPGDALTVREAGDLKRAHSRRGSPIIQARKRGERVPPDEAAQAQRDAAMEKAMREAQEDVDFPKNLPKDRPNLFSTTPSERIGPIQFANQRMSDLHTMENTNNAMRDAGYLGRIGQVGSRAGLGFGLGMTANQLFGVPPELATILGLTAIPLAGPRGTSAAGNAFGLLSNVAPTALRSIELYDEAWKADEELKKKVKRREPK